MMTSYQNVCVSPSLIAPLEPFALDRNVTSLSLFYSYYFGRCLSKLAELVSPPQCCGMSTRYSGWLHDFSVTFPRCYKDFYVNSFILRTATLWNSLPTEFFPLTFDINGYKSRVNRRFFPWILSRQFSSMLFIFFFIL